MPREEKRLTQDNTENCMSEVQAEAVGCCSLIEFRVSSARRDAKDSTTLRKQQKQPDRDPQNIAKYGDKNSWNTPSKETPGKFAGEEETTSHFT